MIDFLLSFCIALSYFHCFVCRTRPRSSLSRGGTRSRPATGNINQIEETDENAPEPEIKKPEPEKEEPQKVEVSKPNGWDKSWGMLRQTTRAFHQRKLSKCYSRGHWYPDPWTTLQETSNSNFLSSSPVICLMLWSLSCCLKFLVFVSGVILIYHRHCQMLYT